MQFSVNSRPKIILSRANISRTKSLRVNSTGYRQQATCGLSTDTPLTLHLGDATVCIPYSLDEAKNLATSFNALLKTFQDKQSAKSAQRWDMMEYKYEAMDGHSEIKTLTMFCNPNAHPSAFDAKLLVNIQTGGGVSFTTEGPLSSVKSDLQAFLSTHRKPE